MDVIMLNSKSKNEAPKNKSDHIIHERSGNTISRSNSEQRKQKERCHGGDGHGHSLSEPPRKHPSKNSQHVYASHRSIQLDEKTYEGARKGSQQDVETVWCEEGGCE
uniref:Uncharacterized protein n=1 Tax=Salix viminalis TaxID=40686 RepID=A0A6N2K1Z2_SALVM